MHPVAPRRAAGWRAEDARCSFAWVLPCMQGRRAVLPRYCLACSFAWVLPGVQGRHGDRYFIIRSFNFDNIQRSIAEGIWATKRHNEQTLNSAFLGSNNVYLIYSVNKSGHFQASRADRAPLSVCKQRSPAGPRSCVCPSACPTRCILVFILPLHSFLVRVDGRCLARWATTAWTCRRGADTHRNAGCEHVTVRTDRAKRRMMAVR
jgi:YT521-B-like domain